MHSELSILISDGVHFSCACVRRQPFSPGLMDEICPQVAVFAVQQLGQSDETDPSTLQRARGGRAIPGSRMALAFVRRHWAAWTAFGAAAHREGLRDLFAPSRRFPAAPVTPGVGVRRLILRRTSCRPQIVRRRARSGWTSHRGWRCHHNGIPDAGSAEESWRASTLGGILGAGRRAIGRAKRTAVWVRRAFVCRSSRYSAPEKWWPDFTYVNCDAPTAGTIYQTWPGLGAQQQVIARTRHPASRFTSTKQWVAQDEPGTTSAARNSGPLTPDIECDEQEIPLVQSQCAAWDVGWADVHPRAARRISEAKAPLHTSPPPLDDLESGERASSAVVITCGRLIAGLVRQNLDRGGPGAGSQSSPDTSRQPSRLPIHSDQAPGLHRRSRTRDLVISKPFSLCLPVGCSGFQKADGMAKRGDRSFRRTQGRTPLVARRGAKKEI